MAQTIQFNDLQDKDKNNSQGQQASNPNVQKGSGFTNFQQYGQANQPQQLGNYLGNKLQEQNQSTNNNINQAGQQFNQQAQQGNLNNQQNLQNAQNVLQDPNAANQQQQSQFSTAISGQYQGPNKIQNLDQLQAQTQALQQMGGLAGNAAGQQTLLQNFVNKPQYTRGQQMFDVGLLGGQQNPQIQAAKRSALQSGNLLGNQEAGAEALAGQYGAESKAFGQQIQNQLGQTVGDLNTQLQGKATQAQTDRDASYKKILSDVQSGNLTQQEADMLGLTQGQQVTGDILNNISKYVSENPDKANAQNIASPEEYAKLQTLQKLSGQNAASDTQNIFGQYQDPTQAGKFAGEQGNMANKDQFGKDIGSELTQYHSQLDPVQQQLDSAKDINRLAQGQVTDTERNAFMNSPQGQSIAAQNQSRLQIGMQPFNQGEINQMIGQSIINQKAPGAAQGGITRTDWASTEQAKAQKAYEDMLNNLSQYGGLKNINIGS